MVRSFLVLMSLPILALAIPQGPIICEDTLNGAPPFIAANVPCLLGCIPEVPVVNGVARPDLTNTSTTPYCELDCALGVRTSASPAQSSRAVDCDRKCGDGHRGEFEQLGWCMRWCVDGGSVSEFVVGTTCVPSIGFASEPSTIIEDGFTVTVQSMFTNPPAWASWYATQTVIPRGSEAAAMPVQTASSLPTTMGTSLRTSHSTPYDDTGFGGTYLTITPDPAASSPQQTSDAQASSDGQNGGTSHSGAQQYYSSVDYSSSSSSSSSSMATTSGTAEDASAAALRQSSASAASASLLSSSSSAAANSLAGRPQLDALGRLVCGIVFFFL